MWAISKISVPSWIENLNPRFIWRKDLVTITEIEQDMWAREEWLWEYARCNECWEIFSKEEIFWHLRKDLRILTVAKIEEALWWEKPNCPICHWKAIPIFDRNQYIDEIRDRYSWSVQSFLTVYRDSKWDIRWFIDWYVDWLDKIYRREFEHYYWKIWADWIKERIKRNLWIDLPNFILLVSAMWMDEWSKNFSILYQLMRSFFNYIYQTRWDMLWMIESTLWSNTHAIYHAIWARRVWIPEIETDNKTRPSDIFVQENAVSAYVNWLSWNYREFFKQKGAAMKEVLVA